MKYFRGLVPSVLVAAENTDDWLVWELVLSELSGTASGVPQANHGCPLKVLF